MVFIRVMSSRCLESVIKKTYIETYFILSNFISLNFQFLRRNNKVHMSTSRVTSRKLDYLPSCSTPCSYIIYMHIEYLTIN